MKNLFVIFLLLLVAQGLFTKCANPKNPTGGAKDTIPPSLIQSEPLNKTLNFNSQTIEMTFDEYIDASKLQSELLITPTYDGDYKHTVKKNRLILEFAEPFTDSTTYTLNFAAGVTDITEKNPVSNLLYVFSTGPYLDSLYVSGKVRKLLSLEAYPNVSVGLYTPSDTLDPSKQKPQYFIKSDEKGIYTIQNIKNGNYKIYAFEDENNNLLLNMDRESYAFKEGLLSLDQSIDSVNLRTVQVDATKFKIISSRPFSQYFDVRYNKPVISYQIQPLDSTLYIYHQLTDESKNIRFINGYSLNDSDSIGVILKASDTVKQTITDTLFLKFNPDQSKPAQFTAKFTSQTLPPAKDTINASINFNKPVTNVTPDSIQLQIDTLYSLAPDTLITTFNKTRTRVNLKIPFDWKTQEDSLLSIYQNVKDSFNTDLFTFKSFNLRISEGAFTSYEQDSSGFLITKVEKYTPTKYGTIFFKCKTNQTHFIIQLLNKNLDPIETIHNTKEYRFTGLKLGTYTFRALIDQNTNGKWDPGNINEDIEPEPVIYYSKLTDVRPNFEIYIEDFQF